MLRVEFHCHTIYSKDSLTRLEHLLTVSRQKRIDRVIVTDHNTIAGAVLAQRLDPKRVIVGEEIMTTQGELLAAFVMEEIPAGLEPLEAIRRLREQGAFISVSHPFDRWRNGHWSETDLVQIAPLVDAIETFNARCMLPRFNHQAKAFAQQFNLPGTVGSDAHGAVEIGKATLLLPMFKNPADLKNVIHKGQAQESLSAPWIHFISRYAVWHKKITGKSPLNP